MRIVGPAGKPYIFEMCGRFNIRKSPEEVARWFGIKGAAPNYPKRYNIAPTDEVLAVRYNPEDSQRHLDKLRWGLVPIWSKDRKGAARLINARCETLANLAPFKAAFTKRRCLIPADGFYEWLKLDAKNKQAFAIEPVGDPMFAFAGLWERWRDPETKEILRSCTIITTNANELMGPIHDRMPVILDKANWSQWLGEADVVPEELRAMLKPYPAEQMRAYKISSRVNSVKMTMNPCSSPLNSSFLDTVSLLNPGERMGGYSCDPKIPFVRDSHSDASAMNASFSPRNTPSR